MGNDLKRAFTEDGHRRTHIGGQALIEGVMMRGKLNWAVAVREPDGHMHSEEHPLSKKGKRAKWLSWPLVRGCVALVDSLVLGYKALEIAANHAYADEGEETEAVAEEVAAGGLCIDGEFDNSAYVAADQHGESHDAAAQHEAPVAAAVSEGPSAPASETVSASGESERPFSWKYDFGRPDTMIDALGAQRTLEVVTEPARPAAPEERQAELAKSESSASCQAEQSKSPKEDEEPFFGKAEMAVSLVMGLVLGVALFIFLPAFASNVLVGEYETAPLAWNIVDGVMRVAIFVFYVWLIGRMKDIKRMFSYHGAEHKTIHCYEHGLELTPENARSFPRLHVRCGTAFLIMVMIIAILVYTVIPLNLLIEGWGISGPAAFALLIVVRIALMPLIAGISYEITVKWAGSHPENPLVRVVLWPGMQMQRLTTNEPDDSMLECAIEAMRLVVEREEAEAARPGSA